MYKHRSIIPVDCTAVLVIPRVYKIKGLESTNSVSLSVSNENMEMEIINPYFLNSGRPLYCTYRTGYCTVLFVVVRLLYSGYCTPLRR
jgi:hypothetical protein